MATLIAHGPEPTARDFAQRLGTMLVDQRGVTTAVEEFPLAAQYVDNVEAIIVVAEARDEIFHRGASNFLAAHYAESTQLSLFVAALGATEELTNTQRAAIDAYAPRDMAYFRTDQPNDAAVKSWVGRITSRGAA